MFGYSLLSPCAAAQLFDGSWSAYADDGRSSAHAKSSDHARQIENGPIEAVFQRRALWQEILTNRGHVHACYAKRVILLSPFTERDVKREEEEGLFKRDCMQYKYLSTGRVRCMCEILIHTFCYLAIIAQVLPNPRKSQILLRIFFKKHYFVNAFDICMMRGTAPAAMHVQTQCRG